MREPPLTCPLIDAAQHNLSQAGAELETIRKANEELRAWGHYWKSEHTLAAAEVRALERRVSDLESQLEHLENRL